MKRLLSGIAIGILITVFWLHCFMLGARNAACPQRNDLYDTCSVYARMYPNGSGWQLYGYRQGKPFIFRRTR